MLGKIQLLDVCCVMLGRFLWIMEGVSLLWKEPLALFEGGCGQSFRVLMIFPAPWHFVFFIFLIFALCVLYSGGIIFFVNHGGQLTVDFNCAIIPTGWSRLVQLVYLRLQPLSSACLRLSLSPPPISHPQFPLRLEQFTFEPSALLRRDSFPLGTVWRLAVGGPSWWLENFVLLLYDIFL